MGTVRFDARVSSYYQSIRGSDAMAKGTSKKSKTVRRRGDKAPARPVAAKPAKPRKAVASQRKPTKETTRAART